MTETQLDKIKDLKDQGLSLKQAMDIIRGEKGVSPYQGPHCPLPKGGGARTVKEILQEYNTYGVVSLSSKEKQLLETDFEIEYSVSYLGHYDGTIYICDRLQEKPSSSEEGLRKYEDYEDKY